jgi:hypothetical protein
MEERRHREKEKEKEEEEKVKQNKEVINESELVISHPSSVESGKRVTVLEDDSDLFK